MLESVVSMSALSNHAPVLKSSQSRSRSATLRGFRVTSKNSLIVSGEFAILHQLLERCGLRESGGPCSRRSEVRATLRVLRESDERGLLVRVHRRLLPKRGDGGGGLPLFRGFRGRLLPGLRPET